MIIEMKNQLTLSSISTLSTESTFSSVSTLSALSMNFAYYLDDLPVEIYHFYLFEYLDLDDILELRLVSKKLYSITRSYSIRKLYFLDSDFDLISFYDYKGNWFSTNESIRSKYQLDISKLGRLRNPINNLALRYLKIRRYEPSLLKLEDLNGLRRLQILMIDGINPDDDDLLELPDLKSLSLGFYTSRTMNYYSYYTSGLIIQTPKLLNLHIYKCHGSSNVVDKIKFTYPRSVKYLKFDYYEENASIFENVECLELTFVRDYFVMSNLYKFRNLKKLRLRYPFLEDVDKLKDLFRQRQHDLEIVLEGVKIKEISKFDEYKRSDSTYQLQMEHCNELKFQLDNYKELENNLCFVKRMNYGLLIRLLPYHQPADLFNKYTNVYHLIVGNVRIDNENRLSYFIKKCASLSHLEIGTPLSQQFYDKLPAISSLNLLKIINYSGVNLKLDFMIKMPYLNRFYTNQDVWIRDNQNLIFMNNFKLNGRQIFCVSKQNKRSNWTISICEF